MESTKKRVLFEHNRNQAIFFCVSMILLLGIYFVARIFIMEKERKEYSIVKDEKMLTSIEGIIDDSSLITLSGWAIYCGVDTSNDVEINLFLKDTMNEKEDIWLKTSIHERSDVNSYYASNKEYLKSGFTSSIDEDKINEDTIYEIMLKYTYTDVNDRTTSVTVSTDKLLQHKLLTDKNDYTKVKPEDIKSDELRHIIDNALVCYYNDKNDIWVYIYQGELYLIAGNNFAFQSNYRTYIAYHTFSTIPLDDKFETLDFYFEDNEVFKEEENVRVAKIKLPDSYPVAYIELGNYLSESSSWGWLTKIQLSGLFSQK